MKIQTNIKRLESYKILSKVKRITRNFLDNKDYLEIDLPVLSPALVPESYLEVFETAFSYADIKEKLYLTPSPELFLKRLLAYGVGNCYYLGKSFRNSDPSATLHSFEFTMLEWYRIHATYRDIADDVLHYLQAVSQGIYKKNSISYQGIDVSFDRWEELTVAEAFNTYAQINEDGLFDKQLFMKKAREKGYKTDGFSYEDVFSQIYTQEIESHLGCNGYPTLLVDYPKEFAALAKLNSDGKTAQRFEFYIAGIELGDCYTELTDWKEQSNRFEIESQKRKCDGKTIHPVDKGFIEALQYGLVDCAGIAIGFERLAMIFANARSISEVKLIDIVT